MIQNLDNKKKQTHRGNLSDPKEGERLLMQYAGIFKNQIRLYADTIIKKNKPVKNLAR